MIATRAAYAVAQDTILQVPAAAAESAPGTVPEAPRVGPPDTTYYMKLGYIVAGVIFVAYIGLMLRRIATIRRSR